MLLQACNVALQQMLVRRRRKANAKEGEREVKAERSSIIFKNIPLNKQRISHKHN